MTGIAGIMLLALGIRPNTKSSTSVYLAFSSQRWINTRTKNSRGWDRICRPCHVLPSQGEESSQEIDPTWRVRGT